jgi:hypothetical protein
MDGFFFSLHEDAFYIEQEKSVVVTSMNMDEEIYTIDSLAKEAFMLAVNGFSQENILELCKDSFEGELSVLETNIENLFKDLVERKILITQSKNPI